MRRIALFAVLLAASATGLPACQSKADRTGQSTRGFYVGSFDMLWEMSRQELGRAGFTPDQENSSRETMTLVTRWRVSLQPFAMKGYRDQATLYFHPVEGRDGYFTVEANVLRQRNKTILEPTNLLKADWEDGSRLPDVEAKLVHDVEMLFITRDVSPEFRSRYGMPRESDAVTPAPVSPTKPPDKSAR